MGSGRWSSDMYSHNASFRASKGLSDFDYSDRTMHKAAADRTVHPNLDPKGVVYRESRDSDEHPNSRGIGVLFDVTGSMSGIPVVLQKKLPQLLGLLLRKGYIDDPQILFGAIGDATCDTLPLQVGQFESDNRMDDNLQNIVLEKGGGGHNTESYELAMYFMVKHVSMDCLEKRGQKGYLFMIGDERPYASLKGREVSSVIGDTVQDMPTTELAEKLKQMFEVYVIIPKGASNFGDSVISDTWRDLFGQNVLTLDDPDAVCELIALTIGLGEGWDLTSGMADLKDLGVSDRALASAGKALAMVPPKGGIIKGSLDNTGPSGNVRL